MPKANQSPSNGETLSRAASCPIVSVRWPMACEMPAAQQVAAVRANSSSGARVRMVFFMVVDRVSGWLAINRLGDDFR